MPLACVSACVDTHIQIVLCKVSVRYKQSENLWLDSQSLITLGGKIALIIVMQPKEHILSNHPTTKKAAEMLIRANENLRAVVASFIF